MPEYKVVCSCVNGKLFGLCCLPATYGNNDDFADFNSVSLNNFLNHQD